MDLLNKELEQYGDFNSLHKKGRRKVNPIAAAQAQARQSRVVSKRLNTLSIFVKKDKEVAAGKQRERMDREEATKMTTAFKDTIKAKVKKV